jgi:hypothetical protein
MKELNKKLATENAIITQADKGKTIVILNSDEYSEKVPIFLAANNFSTLTKHPTDKLRKEKCNLIIDKRQIKFLTQKKTSPPSLKAQPKLHKIGIPIRPVINNRTALAYKLAKHLTKTINQNIILNNHYNIINSTNFAQDFTKLKIHDNHRMITFNIKDLYVNIPIDETLNIIKKQTIGKQ